MFEIKPEDLDILQSSRAVDIPEDIIRKETKDKIESKVDAIDIAKATLKSGLDALSWKRWSDDVMYSAWVCHHPSSYIR